MKKYISFINLTFFVTLFFIFILRTWLSLYRYFDQDEFAFLHWSYLISLGYIPYRDFFINFTPIYFYIISPLLILIQNQFILYATRIFQLVLTVINLIFIYKISVNFGLNKLSRFFTVITYLIFPMLFDKGIEVRIDHLMTLFMLLAIYFAEKIKINISGKIYAFLSGLFFSISFVTLVKIAFLIPCLILIWWKKNVIKHYLAYLLIGLTIPILLFIFYLISNNLLWLFWENVYHGSQLIKAGEGAFSWYVPFKQLPMVYVEEAKISLPWIINILFFITSFIGAFFVFKSNKTFSLITILNNIMMFVSLVVFPTPYLQYFIPYSVIIVMSSSVILAKLIEIFPKKIQNIFIIIVFVIFSASYYIQFNSRKISNNSNFEQQGVIRDILRISNYNDSVYDMVGSYIFRPDSYYICCNVYSTFNSQLRLNLPSLTESLIKTKTKYIVLDRGGKAFWLPYESDVNFLNSNYLPSAFPKIWHVGYRFDCTDSVCKQINAHGKYIDNTYDRISFVIPADYKLITQPKGGYIELDGKKVYDGDINKFDFGTKKFNVNNNSINFSFELNEKY